MLYIYSVIYFVDDNVSRPMSLIDNNMVVGDPVKEGVRMARRSGENMDGENKSRQSKEEDPSKWMENRSPDAQEENEDDKKRENIDSDGSKSNHDNHVHDHNGDTIESNEDHRREIKQAGNKKEEKPIQTNQESTWEYPSEDAYEKKYKEASEVNRERIAEEFEKSAIQDLYKLEREGQREIRRRYRDRGKVNVLSNCMYCLLGFYL